MAINRGHWKPPFISLPSWVCPTCQTGSLSLNKSNLKIVETGSSVRARSHDAWEPEWVENRFSGLLVCQNRECGEIVAVGGRTELIEDLDWEQQVQNWVDAYHPIFVVPAPPIFPLPGECPEVVASELRKAFSLYWSDPGSAANRLRAAAEALLTERKIPRTAKAKKSGRIPLNLHARIEKFKQTAPESADYLFAIKWVGNAGSHSNLDELTHEDLLNGFELFEHVIDLVYVKRDRRLRKIARGINARKGRPIPRRRSTIF